VKDGETCTIHARRETRKVHDLSSRAGASRGARHLFDCWPQVAHSIHAAKHLALFSDFDGTLVAFRRRPSDVKPLGLPLRQVLQRLSEHARLSLFIISGRTLADLREHVPVAGISLLGLHGWEGRDVPPLEEDGRVFWRVKRWLHRHLPADPQIFLEDKGLGLAVHYRGASLSAIRKTRPIIDEVLRVFGPQVRMMPGHKVWELLPRQIEGKGATVCDLLSKMPVRTLPIFVGDDTTDESAFTVLKTGLTIHVGDNHRTKARFRLRNPAEVRAFLLKLEAEIA